MKTSKLDRVVDGLKVEARIVQECIARLGGGDDMIDDREAAGYGAACRVLEARVVVINELVTRLSEVDEAELDVPKRTRKRKAGLPTAEVTK